MSGDPKRWLEDGGGASDVERDLLRGAPDVEPPAGKKSAVWAALVGRLPPGGGGAAGGGGGAAASGLSLAAKGKIAGAVLASLLGAGVAANFARHHAPAGLAAPPSAASLSPNAAGAAAPATAPAPAPTATTLAAATPASDPTSGVPASAPADPPAPRPSSRARPPAAATATSVDPDALREESALVARARDALHAGDPSGALATLDAARARFPRGVLVQERNVLAIEALAARGDEAAASRQAQAFLKQFPGSPLTGRVRPFVR